MKSKTLRLLIISQAALLLLFGCMTFANEIIDLPHLFLGNHPTSIAQRQGEVYLEAVIFVIVIAIESFILGIFYRRIRVLEGFLPICANCKKIRNSDQWEQIEQYITEHSLAKFSHSICPDCLAELYPEFFDRKK